CAWDRSRDQRRVPTAVRLRARHARMPWRPSRSGLSALRLPPSRHEHFVQSSSYVPHARPYRVALTIQLLHGHPAHDPGRRHPLRPSHSQVDVADRRRMEIGKTLFAPQSTFYGLLETASSMTSIQLRSRRATNKREGAYPAAEIMLAIG